MLMLTFTWLTKPAQLASGDLHLVSERTLGFGRITAYKPAKSYFIAFCSSLKTPNCSSVILLVFFLRLVRLLSHPLFSLLYLGLERGTWGQSQLPPSSSHP